MIRRIALFVFLLCAACADATPTRTLVRFSTSAELAAPEGARLRVIGYEDGRRQHEDGEDLGIFPFHEGVTLPVEATDDDGDRRFTLFAELLTESGRRLSWARIRSGFVQDERREVRVEFQADCRDPSDRQTQPANYDANAACGSHDTCAALSGTAACRSACVTPEPIAEETTPSPLIACPIEDDLLVEAVEHGPSYACALSGGEPFCWGQLGTAIIRQPSRTVTPEGRATFRAGVDEVVDVSVSSRIACMVFADGSVRCGGDNADGALTVDTPPGGTRCCQVEPAGFTSATEVVVDSYACALGEDGRLYCSGLVPPHAAGVDEPVSPARRYDRATAPSPWTSLFGGPSILAGLGPERLEVLAGPERFDFTGVDVTSGDVADVAANAHGLCVTMTGGGVRCWGDHEPEDLGAEWRQIAMSSHAADTPSAVGEHRCAIRMDGTLWCWGESAYGMLGVEPRGLIPFEERVQVSDHDDWLDVSVGERVSCGVRGGGHVYCWGSNERRELGRDGDDSHVPARVPLPRW